MEKEPRRKGYTRKEIQTHRKLVGVVALSVATVATIATGEVSSNNNTLVSTDTTYQEAPKIPEIGEKKVPSNIEVGGVNWTQEQRKNGAILMIASGNNRYIEGILPKNSPINSENPSDISVNFENRFGFPINPTHSITTIRKDGENITILVKYLNTKQNIALTTERIVNEPTILSAVDWKNGQTFYFGINPNS